jgi:hypothetical protein
VEYGFGGFDNAPDDDRGDFDRLPSWSLTLSLLLSKVHAQRDAAPASERIHPPESRLFDGSFVNPEQLDDFGLIGVDHCESTEADEVHDENHNGRPDAVPAPRSDGPNER